MDNEPILKKTLVTMGTMVGAWVLFVGTVSLIAVLVTSHVVGSSGVSDSSGSGGASVTAPPGARALTTEPLRPPPAARTAAQRAHDTI